MEFMASMQRQQRALAVANAVVADYAASLEGLAVGSPAREARKKEVHARSAQELLRLAKDNGGIFIKAAQFAASVRGPVPAEYVDALSEVQDRAPARPWEEIRPHLEAQLGAAVDEVFESIEETPVAAASLAQVHRAVLKDGRAVAVKVQYPGLQAQIASDLNMIQMALMMFKDRVPFDVTWLLNELRALLARECDFEVEAANAARARAALAWRGGEVLVPGVIAELSGKQVLVTDFVEGMVRVDDAEGLARAGLAPAAVGDAIARVAAEMMLVHGLVHGDPHAGNVHVRPRRAEGDGEAEGDGGGGGDAAADPSPSSSAASGAATPQVVILDHGLYFDLDEEQRRALCALLRALVVGPRAAARAHAEALAGPLAGVLPLVLSPWFAANLGLREAARLARGEFSIDLQTVVEFLSGMESRSHELLGTAARCAVAAAGAAGATLPLLVFAAPVAIAAAGTYATVGGVAQELLGLPP
eukprot:PRCOL_00006945-RA